MQNKLIVSWHPSEKVRSLLNLWIDNVGLKRPFVHSVFIPLQSIIAKCGVTYFDEVYHSQANFLRGGGDAGVDRGYDYQNEGVDFFEEDVEVSEVQNFERLTIPRFDECEETVVWHDFVKVRHTLVVSNWAM